jgi:hypothetical protein
MFVIHFVGDIHQPLHDSTNTDRGGNCVPVKFFKKKPKLTNRAKGSYSPNLHGIWDTEMPERIGSMPSGPNHDQSVQAFADQLSQDFANDIAAWKSSPIDLEQWAWDSHQLAVDTSYGKLPKTIPLETPQPISTCTDNNNISKRMRKLNEKVGQAYVDAASPVIRQQLAKAGTRLAMVLNQIWP